MGKVLKRIHSGNADDYSKMSKMNWKRGSEPPPATKKEKKRGSLFKKKHNTVHDPIMEYKESKTQEQWSPLLSSAANRKHPPKGIPELNEEPRNSSAPQPVAPLPAAVKRLSRPASSPRLSRMADNKAPATEQVASSLKVKRRPPPPPPPYQKTYPRRISDDLESESSEPPSPFNRNHTTSPPITMQVTPASPTIPRSHDNDRLEEDEDLPPIRSSSSMEELFRNLEEFDELASTNPSPMNDLLDMDRSERDFATIPRSELPPRREEIEVETDIPTVSPSPGHSQPSTPDAMVSGQEPRLAQSPTKDNTQLPSLAPAKPPRRRSKKAEPPSSPAPPPPADPVPQSMSPLPSMKANIPPESVPNGLKSELVTREGSESPQPKPPPRRRSKKMSNAESPPEVVRGRDQDSLEERRNLVDAEVGRNSPSLGKASPVPPPKPGKASPMPPPKPGKSSPPLMQGRDSPSLVHRKSSPILAPKPGKSSPAPPPKPKGLSKPPPGWRANLAALDRPTCSSAPVSRTVSPDDQGTLSASTRESSASTDLLSRSPVVMRRTYAVNASMDPEFSDDELEDCTVGLWFILTPLFIIEVII